MTEDNRLFTARLIAIKKAQVVVSVMTPLIYALLFAAFSLTAEPGSQALQEPPLVLPPGVAELPPGVPRVLNPDGSLWDVDLMFTTAKYENEALRLVIAEANKAAAELNLKEILPITRTNLTKAFISPLGYTLRRQAVGNVTTSNYWYVVSRDYKLSEVSIANYDSRCLEYRAKHQIPLGQLDTNTPYQIATQWLAALSMDVQGLNRDCVARVAVSPHWNDLAELGDQPHGKTFTPLYYVWWTPKNPPRVGTGGASVELFLPTRTLISLTVNDPKYIQRRPLTFTNFATLFPDKAAITTNYPTEPVIIDFSKRNR